MELGGKRGARGAQIGKGKGSCPRDGEGKGEHSLARDESTVFFDLLKLQVARKFEQTELQKVLARKRAFLHARASRREDKTLFSRSYAIARTGRTRRCADATSCCARKAIGVAASEASQGLVRGRPLCA
eukprot:808929-Pleurochrysis_carterae.AAC.2